MVLIKEADKANHRKSTFAIMPEIGWSGRHFDFSIYYKYYLKGNTLYKSSNALNTYYFGVTIRNKPTCGSPC